METTIVYRGNVGIMENEMETTIVYRSNIGIMENGIDVLYHYTTAVYARN